MMLDLGHRWLRRFCAGLLVIGLHHASNATEAGDPARLVLRDDFEAGRFAPEGGLFYKDNPEQRAGRAIFHNGNVHNGHKSLTLTLSPSCPPKTRSCSERAEVWEKPEVLAPYDRSLWYGFAVFLDEPVPRDNGRYVLAQWKREIMAGAKGDFSPFLALRLYRGRFGITVETDTVRTYPIGGPDRPQGCLPGEALVLNRAAAKQTRALVAIEAGTTRADYPGYFNACAPDIRVTAHADLPRAGKGWTDFVFRAQPGPAGGGQIEIIANGMAIATVAGRIGHDDPGLGSAQYFKFGPYRSPRQDDWSVSYDDFRRGPRCEDVIRTGQCPPS